MQKWKDFGDLKFWLVKILKVGLWPSEKQFLFTLMKAL